MNGRLPEIDRQRCFAILAAELVHLEDQKIEAFHLDSRAWKTIEYAAVAVLLFKQFAEHQFHHFPVTYHSARLLDATRLRSVQERTHHNRFAGQIARQHDKSCVRSLAGSGGTTKQNQFF